MKKNERVFGICQGYTSEGLGVVKVDGYPLFVKGMLKGESGDLLVMKANKNYGFARLMELKQRSKERVEPLCPLYKQCGGCQLQHLSRKEQLAFKQQKVVDVMQRIAKVDVKVEDVMGMEEPWYYRNKGQVPFGVVDERVICGFYKLHSNEIIDMNECRIQSHLINEVVQMMKRVAEKYDFGDVIRHVLVKHAFASDEVMLVLIVRDFVPFQQCDWLDDVVKMPQIKTIVLNLNQRQDNVILGDEELVVYGDGLIVDELDGLRFMISSKSFYQVNPVQTVTLYQQALKMAGLSGEETVIDLYCGIGTISLFMAKQAKSVIGIEIVDEAIEDAKRNALLNGVKNVEFVCSDAGRFATQLAQEGRKVDVVCVDPPRKGCDDATIQAIVTMEPKRVVYVSCDPATLARDVAKFEELGYKCEKVEPVDMFPNTVHVETVCLLYKLISEHYAK